MERDITLTRGQAGAVVAIIRKWRESLSGDFSFRNGLDTRQGVRYDLYQVESKIIEAFKP